MVDLSQAKQIEGFSNYWIIPDSRLFTTVVKKQKKVNNGRSGSAPVPLPAVLLSILKEPKVILINLLRNAVVMVNSI